MFDIVGASGVSESGRLGSLVPPIMFIGARDLTEGDTLEADLCVIGTGAAGISVALQCAWHHMGTTRMHTDPKQGVVDSNCRVHGVSNLVVAGGLVFPTGGTAPPTLTIVALALRLAEHIRQHYA